MAMTAMNVTILSAAPVPEPLGEDNPILRIRDLVRQCSGIYHPDARLWLLADRCSRRLRRLGLHSFRDYLRLLTSGLDRPGEMNELLYEVAVGETCFLRNRPQLEVFQQQVLPLLLARKRRQPRKRIRVWSAGCSTGEEAYTLAMLLLEDKPGMLRDCEVEVLATDLNQRSLSVARKGIYGEYAARKLSPYLVSKYFARAAHGQLRIHDSVRSVVRFSQLNLLNDRGMTLLHGVDVIFCRNVLMYFDPRSKQRVLQHFRQNLLPDSYLFLGHSESLCGSTDGFRPIYFPDSRAYLKHDATQREQ